MKEKLITIQEVAVDELAELVGNRLLKIIDDKLKFDKKNDIILTRKETAEFLKVYISLFNWVKKEKIKCYNNNNSRNFKKKELIDSLTEVNYKFKFHALNL